MLAELRGLYFSRHHFSRDITGRLAPFTSFVILVLLAYPDLRHEGLSTGSEYLAMAPIGLPILGAVLYVFVGVFVGAGVNAIAVLLTRLAERIPGGGDICFLEVNPQGQFLFLEGATGVDLTGLCAAFFLKRAHAAVATTGARRPHTATV